MSDRDQPAGHADSVGQPGLVRRSVLRVTRRAWIAGGAAVLGAPRVPAFALPAWPPGAVASLRIGRVDDTASEWLADRLRRVGVRCAFRGYPSWGCLADHVAAAPSGSDLHGALLPRELVARADWHGFDIIDIPRGRTAPPAVLVLSSGLASAAGPRPDNLRIARSFASPAVDARLRISLARLGFATDRVTFALMPPAMLIDNVAAGLADAALVGGSMAATAPQAAAARGMACMPLPAAASLGLAPDLVLALRPGLIENVESVRRIVSSRLSRTT